MISLILTTISFPSAAEFVVLFDQIIKKQSYELLYARPAPESAHLGITYKRTVDGHAISLELGKSRSQGEIDDLIGSFRSGSGAVNPERSPSEIPLGDHSFVIVNSTKIVAVADGFFVIAMDDAALQNSYSVGDTRALESLSRLALAEMIGSTLSIEGAPIIEASHTNQHTHSTYVPLSKIVARIKTKPEVGEWLDRCTVKMGKHKLEFALGSDMVSIDGKSIVIEAFVARQKGEWMIPTKTLRQKGIEGL